jgi:hypothetical protein
VSSGLFGATGVAFQVSSKVQCLLKSLTVNTMEVPCTKIKTTPAYKNDFDATVNLFRQFAVHGRDSEFRNESGIVADDVVVPLTTTKIGS